MVENSPFIVESGNEVSLIIDKWSYETLLDVEDGGKHYNESHWVLNGGNGTFIEQFSSFEGKKGWKVVVNNESRITLLNHHTKMVILVNRESQLVKIHLNYFYKGKPDYGLIDRVLKELTVGMRPTESTIEWVYDSHGSSITIPMVSRKLIHSAYPWINDVPTYIDEYLDSDASVLVLIGPPGTGKTSLIKKIIAHRNMSAYVTYDPELLRNDRFFAMFMEGDTNLLIMEDADAFLANRKEGNTMMHRFLNMSDGLVTTKGKKMIFSTNLPNIRDVDPALVRPGRCFDVLTHRALSKEESLKVLNELKLPPELPETGKNSYTLAELVKSQPHENTINSRPSMGFIR